MPFPILAALGLGASGLSAMGLLQNIANTGDKPDPETIAKAIEEKAMILSRKNGIPMEQAMQAVAEQTTKDVSAEYGFDPTAAVFQVLGLAPGVGMLAKGASIAKATGKGLGTGIKAVAENQGGLKGMMTGGMMTSKATTGRQLKAAGGKARPDQPKGGSTPAEEAAEVASPALRAAHGAEEAGEYGMIPMGRAPRSAQGPIVGSGPTMQMGLDQPKLTMGAQNFERVGQPYEVISPPFEMTRGLPFDPAAYADQQFRRQLMARQMAMREADAAGDFSGYAAY
jgi:hypothetical protein